MTAFADRTVVTIAVRGPLMCRVDTQWDLVIKRGTWGRAGQGRVRSPEGLQGPWIAGFGAGRICTCYPSDLPSLQVPSPPLHPFPRPSELG